MGFSAEAQIEVITGASTRANGAFSSSAEATAISANTAPFGKAVLSCSFSTAPTEGDIVSLYRRDLNIDGSNDATIPEAGYEVWHVGDFPVKDVTTQQFIPIPVVPLTVGDQEFYIEQNADQTMDADYTVKLTPVDID